VIAVVAKRDPDTQLPLLPEPYGGLAPWCQAPRFIGAHTVKYGDTEVYALIARCRGDEDDSAIRAAACEFLDYLA
jgi:hypothetical protein